MNIKSPLKRYSVFGGGGNAFHSLLTKKVKDLCMYSKLNVESSNLVLSPCKLYLTFLRLKNLLSNIGCSVAIQALV